MWRFLWASSVLVASVAPASADDRNPAFAVGYSLVAYLEEGGGSAPLGFNLSAATAGNRLSLEADIAYHRDSEQGGVLNTITAGVGPRWGKGGSNASPFVHALALLRRDSFEDASNTSFGGMVGGGVDLGRAGRARFRLGADFQIVFDGGENLKTLRLTAGVRF